MRNVLLILAFVVAASELHAGPNAAVNCKGEIESKKVELEIFDISLFSQSKVTVLRGQYSGLTAQDEYFGVEDINKFVPKISERKDRSITISYVDAAQKRAVLTSSLSNDKSLGRIVSITYSSDNAPIIPESQQRKGKVLIKLQDSVLSELKFDSCSYQGGRVSDWDSIWSKE